MSSNVVHGQVAGSIRDLSDMCPAGADPDRWAALGDIRRAQALLRSRGSSATHTFEPLPQFLARVPAFAPPDLVAGLIPFGGITMLHGQPRDLKSLMMLEIILAMATGTPAFGMPRLKVPEPLRVAYISEEDSEALVAYRLRLLLEGRQMKEIPENLLLMVGQGVNLDHDESTFAVTVARECRERRLAFLVLDPLRSVAEGVDQGPAELKPLARWLRGLLKSWPMGIGIVHHDVKASLGRQDRGVDRRSLPQRASGGGIFSIADAPIHVKRLDDERVRLTPAAFKAGPDPDRIVVRLESDHTSRPTWMRLVGANHNDAIDGEELRRAIISALSKGPIPSSNEVARTVGARKPLVLAALEDLLAAGSLQKRPVGRAHEWSLAPQPTDK